MHISFETDGSENAIHQVNEAAREKISSCLGADVGQQLLRAKLADELQVVLAACVLGSGWRLFDHLEDLEIHLKNNKP
ncbi:dihydrofolate reductase family protein [Marinococcus halophilus]|uniref:dihydrofolate reductase family protein n=1 Tax=Marinococcus halophilus TaxID=1371 RepID=UPI0009A88F42|nr:dihydrofolate reductase family protein [Marinococcus halophilus]